MNAYFKFNLLTVFVILLGCDEPTRDSTQSAAVENGATSSTYVLVKKPWHNVERLQIEPFSLPSISMDQIASLKEGDSVADIEKTCGFKPFKYYEGVDFGILYARLNTGEVYEVAFLIKHETEIEDISYRIISKGQTDFQSEVDPFGQ